MSASSAAHGALSTLFSNLFITLPIPKANLDGQTYIVTGSNAGLGLEASRHLNKLGASKLIMAVRSVTKGEAAKAEILRSTGRDENSIEVWELDMASYSSIKQFSAQLTSKLGRVDGVLANAGIMVDTFQVFEDNESTLTVNVVGTCLLFMLLLPKLRESADMFNISPRFTIPNSALHYMASLKELNPDEGHEIFSTMNSPKTADMAARYNVSKLLVIYAVRELAQRANNGSTSKSHSGKINIINTPNPSFCKSSLMQGTAAGRSKGGQTFERLLARSTEEGSRALVHGVIAGSETSGQYLTNCHVST